MLIGMSRLQSILPLRNGDVWVTSSHGGIARRIAENAYDPAWSPDGKKIVYVAQRDGEWGLWIREVDAPSPPRRLNVVMPTMPDIEWAQRRPEARFRGMPLSVNPNVMIQPAWSPDGKWIAFTAGRDPFLRVFVTASEGGEAFLQTEASGNAQMPSWSPDGRWLFFSSERNGRINLYKARFQPGQLSQPRQLTLGSGADLQARLDPQGTRLAYSSVRDVQDLWEYDLKTSRETAVTSETTDEDNASPSPDGAWLAFVSNRLNGRHLWLLNRRTGGLTQLPTAPNSFIEYSRWTRDGRYLLYRSRDTGYWQYEASTGAHSKVYEGDPKDEDFCVSADDKYLIIAQESGDFVRLERSTGRREDLARVAAGTPGGVACSPDGQWVAAHVTRKDDNDRDIWLIPLAGGTPRQLTFGRSEDSHPTWSANSQLVYFLRNHQDIYAVPPSGGESKPVTRYRSFGTTLDYPVVSGDGRKILFTRVDKAGNIYLLEHPTD
jgi:TolB protein